LSRDSAEIWDSSLFLTLFKKSHFCLDTLLEKILEMLSFSNNLIVQLFPSVSEYVEFNLFRAINSHFDIYYVIGYLCDHRKFVEKILEIWSFPTICTIPPEIK